MYIAHRKVVLLISFELTSDVILPSWHVLVQSLQSKHHHSGVYHLLLADLSLFSGDPVINFVQVNTSRGVSLRNVAGFVCDRSLVFSLHILTCLIFGGRLIAGGRLVKFM